MTKKIFAVGLTLALAAAAGTAFADGNDNVVVTNSADVINVVSSSASTGSNWAGGSRGGDGGRGGNIYNGGGEDTQDVSDSSTGNGGNGGDGSTGGEVRTGNAMSRAYLSSTVNDTTVDIDRCACNEGTPTEEGDNGDSNVIVGNAAVNDNVVAAGADTGSNGAEGSEGGMGGYGGDIYNGGAGTSDQDVDDSHTGSGGHGGHGGLGGLVLTGSSDSAADAVSVVNRTVVRIRR